MGVGPLDVTVDNGFERSPTVPGDVFTYTTLLSVTGVSPSSGGKLANTAVVITGTGFTGATAVHFGIIDAASFTVDSDTRITAVSPHGLGPVDVRVIGVTGISPVSPADQYTFPPA